MSDTADLYQGSLAPEQAVERLMKSVSRIVDAEVIDSAAAAGRLLSKDALASSNLPATNNAAVDGYAVDAGFLEANPAHEFNIIGKAAAGHPFSGSVGAGEAVRIFTGAVMPEGADAVAMRVCDADEVKGTVRIGRRLASGSNNRPAGENLRASETIARSGCRLGAAEIGILSAAGQARVSFQKTSRRPSFDG